MFVWYYTRMITYTWDFPSLGITKQLGDKQDVIHTVEWILTGIDESGIFDSVRVSLHVPLTDTFIPLADVTKTMLEQWVEDTIDTTPYKESIAASIEKKKSETDYILVPSW